jgi:hypothetical protein
MLQDVIDNKVSVSVGGKAQTIRDHRNAQNADIVAFLVKSRAKAGLAHTMQNRRIAFEKWAYCVVNDYKADKKGYHSLAHEIGHLFGCCHDRVHYQGVAIAEYARAHFWQVQGANEVRTIMCESHNRIPYFSNPLVRYMGTQTGIPIGMKGESDNAKVISDSASIVARFR